MEVGRAAVLTCADEAAAAAETASEFACAAFSAVAQRGRFCVAIPGGAAPRRTFELLADDLSLPWRDVHVFFTDERCVAPDDPESNYRLASDLLLSKVPVPPEQVHRFEGELPPEEAASRADIAIRNVLGPRPRIDFVLLGMGDDTHTASLFPHTPALNERSRLAVANYVAAKDTYRLTLTFQVLCDARNIIVLVTGSEKAEAVRVALEGPPDVGAHPIQGVQPTDGRMVWIVDRAAAALL